MAQMAMNLSISVVPDADEMGNYWVTMQSPQTGTTYVSAVTRGATDEALRKVMAQVFMDNFLAEMWQEVERNA